MVVAGSGPRAVVTTASYEARRFGIFSATPAERARRACPDAVFIPPDFEAYRARSREVMDVLRAHVERVEVVGLDEAYLDLSGFERPRAAARRVKAVVTEATGLGCSVGIGPNKLVAKVASDAEKPNGFVVLSAEQACERFAGSPPGLLPGIGPKTAERLERQGIELSARLRATPEELLSQWFGSRLGPWLGALARFEDHRELETVRVAKSESRETTFDQDLRGLGELEPQLRRLTEQLCETLERQERSGRTIGIKVRLRRLLDRHPGAICGGPGERAGRGLGGCGGAAAPPRPTAAGQADRRARGRTRRGGRSHSARGPAQAHALSPLRRIPLKAPCAYGDARRTPEEIFSTKAPSSRGGSAKPRNSAGVSRATEGAPPPTAGTRGSVATRMS